MNRENKVVHAAPIEPWATPTKYPTCPRDGATLWRKDGKHYCLECGQEYEYGDIKQESESTSG